MSSFGSTGISNALSRQRIRNRSGSNNKSIFNRVKAAIGLSKPNSAQSMARGGKHRKTHKRKTHKRRIHKHRTHKRYHSQGGDWYDLTRAVEYARQVCGEPNWNSSGSDKNWSNDTCARAKNHAIDLQNEYDNDGND